MEAISALGVAASVIQIVNLAGGIVRDICEGVQSATGELNANIRMREQADRLKNLASYVENTLDRRSIKRPFTDTEALLIKICHECNEKAEKLAQKLAQLDQPDQLDHDQPDKKLSKSTKFKMAVYAVWEKSDIEDMRQRLVDAKDQLMMVILASLQYDQFRLDIRLSLT